MPHDIELYQLTHGAAVGFVDGFAEEILDDCRVGSSSGVYICKSVVNDLRHGNFICKSEENYLDDRHVVGSEGFELHTAYQRNQLSEPRELGRQPISHAWIRHIDLVSHLR